MIPAQSKMREPELRLTLVSRENTGAEEWRLRSMLHACTAGALRDRFYSTSAPITRYILQIIQTTSALGRTFMGGIVVGTRDPKRRPLSHSSDCCHFPSCFPCIELAQTTGTRHARKMLPRKAIASFRYFLKGGDEGQPGLKSGEYLEIPEHTTPRCSSNK